jgi:hypothetical protein
MRKKNLAQKILINIEPINPEQLRKCSETNRPIDQKNVMNIYSDMLINGCIRFMSIKNIK